MTTEERIGVQRSLSLLQHTKTKSGPNGGGSFHHHQRLDMLGPLPGLPPSRDLSPTSNNQISTISDKVDIGGMRHAIIRRHNSMYTSSTRNMGHSLLQPPYKLHDVSGASEVRPIVTLQRSKTSITPSTGPYYRAAALQSVARYAAQSAQRNFRWNGKVNKKVRGSIKLQGNQSKIHIVRQAKRISFLGHHVS